MYFYYLWFMDKNYVGVVKLAGKEYNVKVVDGVRYINDMVVDDFLKQCTFDEMLSLALLGKNIKENKKVINAQEFITDIHKARYN